MILACSSLAPSPKLIFRTLGPGGRDSAQVEMNLSIMPSSPPRQEGSFCEQDVRVLLRLR